MDQVNLKRCVWCPRTDCERSKLKLSEAEKLHERQTLPMQPMTPQMTSWRGEKALHHGRHIPKSRLRAFSTFTPNGVKTKTNTRQDTPWAVAPLATPRRQSKDTMAEMMTACLDTGLQPSAQWLCSGTWPFFREVEEMGAEPLVPHEGNHPTAPGA